MVLSNHVMCGYGIALFYSDILYCLWVVLWNIHVFIVHVESVHDKSFEGENLRLDTKYTISWKTCVVDVWQSLAPIKLNALLVRFLFDFQILQQQIMGKFLQLPNQPQNFSPLNDLPCMILYYCIITKYLTHAAPGFYIKIYQLVFAKINPYSFTRHWPASF